MKAPIINVSRQMHPVQRFLTIACTAVLWVFWLYLWQPVVAEIQQQFSNITTENQSLIRTLQTVNSLSPVSLTNAFFALTGTSTLLLLWTFLPGKTRTYHHRIEMTGDYARYFQLSETSIIAGRQSRICTVYHDDSGHIVQIETNTTPFTKSSINTGNPTGTVHH